MKALASSSPFVPTGLLRTARRVLPSRFLILCACAIALPLASRPAAAQTLINGGVVSGAISTVGGEDSYTFAANAGDGIQLQMAEANGTSLYPRMRLYNPSGTLAQAASGASVASMFRPAGTTGTYTLVVSDWTTTGTGGYDVYFTLAPGANENGALDNGGVRSGTIDLGDLDSYTFTANAGEGIQLQMAEANGTSVYPLMRLYNPSGTLAQAASGASVASMFRNAGTTGTYTLVVSDWTTTGTGDYDLYFTRRPGANEGGPLINGGVVSGTIDLGDLDSYTFTANAGEGIQLQMAEANGTSLYPLMRLYNPSGTLAQASSGASVTSIFRPAGTTGTYTLVVSDWTTTGTGDYDVYFTLAPGANEGGALVNGGVRTGTIDLGDLDSYTFTANAGESIQLQMAEANGTSLYPLMRLYSPAGALVQAASGASVASMFRPAGTTGTYTLVVSDWTTTGTGDYDVYFTLAPGANEGGALINGGLLSGTIDLGDLDSYTFTANAGEGIRLQMAEANGTSLYPLMRLYNPSGALLQASSGPSVANIVRTAPTSGTYTLVVSDWTTTGTGDYGLFFSGEAETYCTAKAGLFCGTPSIDGQGSSSATSNSGFVVSAQPARSNRSGLLLYTNAGRGALPFSGGTLCISTPLKRSAAVSSGGTPGGCDGVFSIDVNAFAQDLVGGNPAGFLLVVGTQVNAQWWGRDSLATGAFLSNGIEWGVGP